jgi:DNA repair protein SbcD/Mre11
MTVRFIHTADIHLDSPLSGLSTYADAPLNSMRTATRRAFEGLIDFAISEQVDFIVISGDLYDGTWKDYNTGLFFSAQMGRLKQADIRVVVLYGNHDAESDLTRATRLRLPDNVCVFDSREAHTILFENHKVALHGRSFWQRDVTENLVKQYPEPVSGWFNIGVLHTALGGRDGHASYAPTSLEELRAKGYEYWALGHVHATEVIDRAPYVVFPGCLQGRHIREPGPHGAYLIELEESRVTQLTRFETDVIRWQSLTIDATSIETFGEFLTRFESSLSRVLDESNGRSVAVRVTLCGRTQFHAELFRKEAHLRAEMQAVALGFGLDRAWVEKIRLETEPASEFQDTLTTKDVIADLKAMLIEAADDSSVLGELRKEFGDLFAKLPPEVRGSNDPLLALLRQERIDEIIRLVTTDLLSQVVER